MIKPCRKVLSELRKLSSSTDDILCFLGDTCCISLYSDYTKTYDYSNYSGEIRSIVKQLVNDGYMEYSVNEYHFSLTQKGLHPYRFTWDSIKHFLFTSVLVPIVVAFVTSLLTLLIEGLL